MKRSLHPLPAFRDGLVGQPDDLHPHLAGSHHHLHLDRHSLHALKCHSAHMRNHVLSPCARPALQPEHEFQSHYNRIEAASGDQIKNIERTT